MSQIWKMTLVVWAFLLVAGCSGGFDGTPTVTAITNVLAEPTSIQEPTATRIPLTPSPTPFPSPEAPLPIPDTVPMAGLNPEGPWLVFDSGPVEEYGMGDPSDYLWGMNADDASGTGLLDPDRLLSDFKQNPYDKKLFVYVAQESDETVPILKMLQLPKGTITEITPIAQKSFYFTDEDKGQEEPSFLLFASYARRNPSWSPDGTKIAFTGMLDDQSIDVYVYDFTTNEVKRIADMIHYDMLIQRVSDTTANHPYDLQWSPDGQYVLFKDFWLTNMSIPSSISFSLWAAHVDGQHQVLAADSIPDFGGPEFFGWWGSGHTIVTDQGWGEGYPILLIDLETGLQAEIDQVFRLSLFWSDVAYSEEHNAWLITDAYIPGDEPGEHTMLVIDGVVTDIQNDDLSHAEWLDDEGVFLAYDDENPDTKYVITLDGEITVRPPDLAQTAEEPVYDDNNSDLYSIRAPDDSLLLWVERSGWGCDTTGLWVGTYGEPPQRIYQSSEEYTGEISEDLFVSHVRWSPDSQHLILFTTWGIFFAHRPEFELVQMTGYPLLDTGHSVWVDP